MTTRPQQIPQFDLGVACQMALAAELVYREPGEIAREMEQLGYGHCSFFDSDGTQCFVADNHQATVVAFRGTEAHSVTDWATDLDFDLVDGPLGGRVHEGFYDALSNVWKLLDHEVALLQNGRRKQLWITGHSLGAALATLAVARWHEGKRPLAGLYAFGQPRTGDKVFARNFDFVLKPYTFRFVNNNDFVTRTPPRVLGYRHVGTFKYFNTEGQLVDEIGWWRSFLDRFNGNIENLTNWCGHGVNDHSMSSYRQQLDRTLGERCQVLSMQRQTWQVPGRAATSLAIPALIRPRRRAA